MFFNESKHGEKKAIDFIKNKIKGDPKMVVIGRGVCY
jgi:hypothetical protein